MKKIFYLSLSLCYTLGFSNVITVNNNTNAIGMFETLQEGVNAAFVGDTVLLHGSLTSYGDATINKKLTILGEGYLNSVDGKAKKTTIGNISLDSVAGGSEVSGTVFEGLSTDYLPYIYSSNNFAVHKCVIKNCSMLYGTYIRGNDWEIIDSKCNGLVGIKVPSGFQVTNVTIHNTLASYISGFYGGLVSNCVFTSYSFSTLSFLQFQNCIFSSTNQNFTNTSNKDIALLNCSFVNDQTIDASRNITATNCLFSNDPRFLNTIDYQLNPEGAIQGSDNKLIDAGTDGTDIGLSGGSYPIKVLDGRVNLPQVYQLVVKTGVIAPGDILEIQVIGRTRK